MYTLFKVWSSIWFVIPFHSVVNLVGSEIQYNFKLLLLLLLLFLLFLFSSLTARVTVPRKLVVFNENSAIPLRSVVRFCMCLLDHFGPLNR